MYVCMFVCPFSVTFVQIPVHEGRRGCTLLYASLRICWCALNLKCRDAVQALKQLLDRHTGSLDHAGCVISTSGVFFPFFSYW
jgi:hypothetical protein